MPMPPDCGDMDADVAAAWQALRSMLAAGDEERTPRAVVTSPAFVAAVQDFSRLLGHGVWDPHAVGAGASARISSHFNRLLTDPGLNIAAWTAQRPDMGSKSRRHQQAAATASAPVTVGGPSRVAPASPT